MKGVQDEVREEGSGHIKGPVNRNMRVFSGYKKPLKEYKQHNQKIRSVKLWLDCNNYSRKMINQK